MLTSIKATDRRQKLNRTMHSRTYLALVVLNLLKAVLTNNTEKCN